MTLTIDLSPKLEAKLREEAARMGVDAAAFVARALEHRLGSSAQTLCESESDLLQRINLGLSEQHWRRYRELVGKRIAETLSPIEQTELIALSDQIEHANARRLAAVLELARARGTSLEVMMKELGIRPVPVANDG